MHGRVQFDALFIITSDRANEETEIVTLKHFKTVRRASERPAYCLFFNPNHRCFWCAAVSGLKQAERRWKHQMKQKEVRATKDRD